MPCVGPICSARSSLVLMGLPTTRSSMFIGMVPDGLFARKNKVYAKECAQRCVSTLTITLLGCTIKNRLRAANTRTHRCSFQTYIGATRMFKAGQFERLAVSLFVTIALKTEVRTEQG